MKIRWLDNEDQIRLSEFLDDTQDMAMLAMLQKLFHMLIAAVQIWQYINTLSKHLPGQNKMISRCKLITKDLNAAVHIKY